MTGMEKSRNDQVMTAPWKIALAVIILGALVLIVLISQYDFVTRNDKNGDGQIDEWLKTTFSGKKVEFSRDKDFDGRVDYVEYYVDDKLSMVKIDFNYDGEFETWAHYDPDSPKEIQFLLERDTNGDGKPDRRSIYDKDTGLEIRVEVDEDFDGNFEKVLRPKKDKKQGK